MDSPTLSPFGSTFESKFVATFRDKKLPPENEKGATSLILPILPLLNPIFSILPLLVCLTAFSAVAQTGGSLGEELAGIEEELERLPRLIPSLQTHERIGFNGLASDPAWIRIDFERSVTPEKIVLFPAKLPISEQSASNGFPSAFDLEISDTESFESSVTIARWEEPEPEVGLQLPFLSFAGNGASGRFLRVVIRGFREDPIGSRSSFYRLGEIVVLENGTNVALKRLPITTRSIDNPRRWEASNLTDGYFWCLPMRGVAGSPSNGFHSQLHPQEFVGGEQWVEIDLGTPQSIEEIHLVPAHPRDFPDSAGFGFPPRFWVISDPGTEQETELLREVDPPFPAQALPNPGAAQVTIATNGLTAQVIRLTCETLWRRGPAFNKGKSEYLFALSEIKVLHHGKNLAKDKTVRFSDVVEARSWDPDALVDGFSSREALLSWDDWIEAIERTDTLQRRVGELRSLIDQRRTEAASRWRGIALMTIVFAALLGTILVLYVQSRSVRAREDLRSRIARDLHDEIGASLSHLAIQTHLAGQALPESHEQRKRLDSISGTARETFDNMRDIVWMLSPTGGTWEEFSDRAESIAKRLLSGVNNHVSQVGKPPPGEPPVEWARSVLRILKEAITNSRRHSQAKEITVDLVWSAGTFELKITDDGIGFEPNDPDLNPGQGLRNLRQRAASLKGKLEVLTSPGSGTSITLEAPLPTKRTLL